MNIGGTTTVGSYPDGVSPYGALDMMGNVWEWVNDWYDENYYSSSPQQNPTGPLAGDYHVLRGGSWYYNVSYSRSARRTYGTDHYRLIFFGFRCVATSVPIE
jgi:formylglycine-generating enzyme required for sulfatase activity